MPKRLLFWMSLAVMILRGAVAVSADEPSASELLNATLLNPGSWSQMCAPGPYIPFSVPFPLYDFIALRLSSLSVENVARLLARRTEIAPLVVSHLRALDLSKTRPRDGSHIPASYGSIRDPEDLSGVLLKIILELHLTEALPELQRIEADLNQQIELATINGGLTLPELHLDSPTLWKETGRGFESTPENHRLFAARVYQREILSVMAALLRYEKYKPLLASAIEGRYRESLTNEAGTDRRLKSIKKAEDIPTDWAGWIIIDPIYDLPVYKSGSRSIPYTPELRRQIRQFVKDYLELPADQRGATSPTLDKK